MKLGFLTACLPDRTLPQLCEWAAAEGYEALEVAAWPDLGDRPFTATHLDVERCGAAEADVTRSACLSSEIIRLPNTTASSTE